VNIISKYYSFYCIFDQSLHLLQHATLKKSYTSQTFERQCISVGLMDIQQTMFL